MRVADIMRRSFEVAHLHEPLDRVLDRLAVEGTDVIPVVDGDKVVGLVTRDAVEHALTEAPREPRSRFATSSAPAPPTASRAAAWEARAAMRAAGVYCLAVLNDNEELVGLVHESDVPGEEDSVAAPAAQMPGADDAGERHAGLKVYAERPRLQSGAGEPDREPGPHRR